MVNDMFNCHVVTDSVTSKKLLTERNTGRLIATLGSQVTDEEAYVLAGAPAMAAILKRMEPTPELVKIVELIEGRELLARMRDE